MLLNAVMGPQANAKGTNGPVRIDQLGDLVNSELHGRFYLSNYWQNLFTMVGVSNTALVAANAIATGVTSTAQPVIGIWNPTGSGFNLVILKAILQLATVAGTAVNPGGFMWCVQTNQGGLTLGSVPYNTKTLLQAGSVAKTFSVSVALTGLVGSLAVLRASELSAGLNAAGAATAVSIAQSNPIENIDGGIIVPPGGVLALMNQVSTTTVSVSTGLLWEEVPI
jgi:hypothetical protein